MTLASIRETTNWRVERHGGQSAHRWRLVFTGVEFAARDRFQQLAEALRQGGVRLIRPDGGIDGIVTAPRLRTKW